MLFKWYNLQMLRRKKISTKEWKKKLNSCLHSDSWRLDLCSWGSQAQDPWWSSCVCMYASTCSPPFCHLCSTWGWALSVGHSTPAHSGWQTAQPAPHSLCHCLLRVPATAERLSVSTFHLLYYNADQKGVPETPVCRYIYLWVMPLCDHCHPFLTTTSNTI